MFSYRNKPALRANGTILTASFVKIDPTQILMCLQAVAGDPIIGISQIGQEYAPVTVGGVSLPTYAAAQGDEVQVYFDGDYCQLQVSTTVVAGQELASDANGYGVPAVGGQSIGAIALMAGVAGDLIQVIVKTGVAAGTGSTPIVTAVASTTITVDQAQSRPTFIVNTTGETFTLPLAINASGAEITIYENVAAAGTALLPGNGTDSVQGNGLTVAAGHGVINTAGTAVIGDYVTVVSDGVSKWFIKSIKGTWAAD